MHSGIRYHCRFSRLVMVATCVLESYSILDENPLRLSTERHWSMIESDMYST